MKVQNIAKQLKDNTFCSVSTRQKFLLLFNADYEVQIGNRSWIIWFEKRPSGETDVGVLEKITKELNKQRGKGDHEVWEDIWWHWGEKNRFCQLWL